MKWPTPFLSWFSFVSYSKWPKFFAYEEHFFLPFQHHFKNGLPKTKVVSMSLVSYEGLSFFLLYMNLFSSGRHGVWKEKPKLVSCHVPSCAIGYRFACFIRTLLHYRNLAAGIYFCPSLGTIYDGSYHSQILEHFKWIWSWPFVRSLGHPTAACSLSICGLLPGLCWWSEPFIFCRAHWEC